MESVIGDAGSPGSPPRSEPSEPSRVLDTEMRGTVMMELIVDKLKLLNYERKFCNSRTPPWPRLHKFYFALPSTNRNEQFLYFAAIVAWLFEFLGSQFVAPSEADDPNVTCSKIMAELMSLGFGAPNWPPARLKQGYGDAVCSVLDALCSLVLDEIKYEFTPVTHIVQEEPILEEAQDDSPSELYIPDDNPDSDEDIPRAAVNYIEKPAVETLKTETLKKRKPDIDRATSQVVATDWRAHLNHAKGLYEQTFARFDAGKVQLKRLELDVTQSLEKLHNHEEFVNQELESVISEYVAVKERLSEAEQEEREKREEVANMEREHAGILEKLDHVKQKLVEKGNEVADLSPMLHMKAAITKLKSELRDMEVQIGVLQHTLVRLQAQRAFEEARA